MNKRYASILALAAVGYTTQAQRADLPVRSPYAQVGHSHTPASAYSGDRSVLFQDDFATDANWTLTVDPSGFQGVTWQIGVGLESTGPYGTPAIASTTAANGYAMLCSDCGNNTGSDYEKASMTTAQPIDMSGAADVFLEFQTQYRRFTNEQTYISVSTDGVTWPEPPSDTATIDLPDGLYPVWKDGELETSVSPGNPTIRRFNLSCVAAGQAQVWVRFYWYGIYGYAWYVDDVVIRTMEPVDVALLSCYLSHPGTGDEYSRIPQNQVGNTLHVGGQVYNLGAEDLTGVSIAVDIVDGGGTNVLSYTTSTTDVPVVACSLNNIFVDEAAAIGALTPGQYTATYVVSAAPGTVDGDLTNNTIQRIFEITPSTGVYSLDGIGVHPADQTGTTSLGTNSFTDNPSGIYCMTNYHVIEPATVYGLWVGLSSTTTPDGIIVASLHDSTDVLRPNADVSVPFVESSDYFITQADIDAGFAIVPFQEPYQITPGTLYYAATKLISANTDIIVRVVDDVTIPEPAWSSLIWLPVDGNSQFTYSNGNAFAIRLLLDPNIGMEEREELTGVSLFPNPTTGLVNLNFTVPGSYKVEIINALGEVVATHRLNGNSSVDMGSLARGVYSVRISNSSKSTVQRVSVN